jgi:beta-lactam-binding protein with PASTA domain
VDLFVSGGLAIVPDLYNQPFSVAEKMLNELGLSVGIIRNVYVDNARLDTLVQAQKPNVGEQVLPGSEVDLSIGQFDTRPFRTNKTIIVNIPDSGASVRVMLVEPDGKENQQYSSFHALAGVNEIEFELRSAISGDMVYRVYVNDILMEETQIAFE